MSQTEDVNDYAANHMYAQGQQWVPERVLVKAQQEIERLQARLSDSSDEEIIEVLLPVQELHNEVARLRRALSQYVTSCHACHGVGEQPRPGHHPCLECRTAREALATETHGQ